METTDRLLAEIAKSQDTLTDIKFTLGEEPFTFCFRYLTLLEKVRIEQMCTKPVTTIGVDGVASTKFEKQDHLIPIHTILEKALDEDGKKLFSHHDRKHFQLISDFPAALASMVAYNMSLDVFGSMKKD